MPAVKSLTRIDKRETEIVQNLAKATATAKLSYREACRKAGVEYATFMKHKKNPGKMRLEEYWRVMDTCEMEGARIGAI